MPIGQVGEEMLQHLRVYPRPGKERQAYTFFAKLQVWVRAKHILEIDRALRLLLEANPRQSLSTIVCNLILKEAEKLKRANKLKGSN